LDMEAAATAIEPEPDNAKAVKLTEAPKHSKGPIPNSVDPDLAVWEEVTRDDGPTSSPDQPSDEKGELHCEGVVTTK
ncbi:MAG: hypothetical protein Q9184_007766, partial [Pyrenodesmia sp. 2 TL-2023]